MYMVQQRSLLKLILLSFITFGIYDIWFWYKYGRDLNFLCQGDGEETPNYVVALLLGIVTCGIYLWYWNYKVGGRLQRNAPRYGLYFTENGASIILWYLVGVFLCGIGPFVAMHIQIKNINALAIAYNSHASGYTFR